jgi:hypothetical protein
VEHESDCALITTRSKNISVVSNDGKTDHVKVVMSALSVRRPQPAVQEWLSTHTPTKPQFGFLGDVTVSGQNPHNPNSISTRHVQPGAADRGFDGSPSL